MSRTEWLGIISCVCIEQISLKMIRLLSSFHWIPSGSLRVCAGNIPQISSWMQCRVGFAIRGDGIQRNTPTHPPKVFCYRGSFRSVCWLCVECNQSTQLDNEHLSSSPQSIYIYLESSSTCAFQVDHALQEKAPLHSLKTSTLQRIYMWRDV